ncbi:MULTISPECIES: hypothetical protein [Streptomyces]|uniref:hypothetical protein n=1 Tax=Streptomyces TaxID=1883 RepID=UPI0017834C58|nr:hypothetical protein [Streptomyces filipinensis]
MGLARATTARARPMQLRVAESRAAGGAAATRDLAAPTSPTQFDPRQVVAWLLAHDKIGVPTGPTVASLVLADLKGGYAPVPASTDTDADALAELAAGEFGASVRRLTAPGTGPLAVPGRVQVIDRFRSGSGGLRVTLAWPAGLRGAASEGATGGLVHHGVAYVAPGDNCVCRRFACGGVTTVSWCQQHGQDADPVMEWHPEGGLRCTALAAQRTKTAARG